MGVSKRLVHGGMANRRGGRRCLAGKVVSVRSRRRAYRNKTALRIIMEQPLTSFDFWSGARQRVDELTYEDLQNLEYAIEDLYPDGLTATELNDLFWFDEDFIAQCLGYEDWGDMESQRRMAGRRRAGAYRSSMIPAVLASGAWDWEPDDAFSGGLTHYDGQYAYVVAPPDYYLDDKWHVQVFDLLDEEAMMSGELYDEYGPFDTPEQAMSAAEDSPWEPNWRAIGRKASRSGNTFRKAGKARRSVRSSRGMRKAASWSDFDSPIADRVNELYLPDYGEGDTMASQIATAVNKLVYKWFNDGDVFDNVHTGLDGFANDISDCANWLYTYVPFAKDELSKALRRISEAEYEEILFGLFLATLCDEDLMADYANLPATGSVYSCNGPFEWDDSDDWDDDDDDDGEWW